MFATLFNNYVKHTEKRNNLLGDLKKHCVNEGCSEENLLKARRKYFTQLQVTKNAFTEVKNCMELCRRNIGFPIDREPWQDGINVLYTFLSHAKSKGISPERWSKTKQLEKVKTTEPACNNGCYKNCSNCGMCECACRCLTHNDYIFLAILKYE